MRLLPIAVLLLLSPFVSCAQLFFSGSEYGVLIGASQYFGDLNENYGFKFTRPVGGIYYKYHLNPYISLRTNLSYTKVGYDDALSDNPYQKVRNLSFRSDIVEATVQAEFNFTRFQTGEKSRRFSPYLTLGVGAFYYNPYAMLGSKKYYLKPLGTEGQNLGDDYKARQYHRIAASFPVGAGFKYWVRPGLNFGFEIADHLTTTDYLDDVSTTYVGEKLFPNDPMFPNPAFYLQDPSIPVDGKKLGREAKQRGNSSTKDQFLYGIFTISFQLKVYRCPTYLNKDTYEDN